MSETATDTNGTTNIEDLCYSQNYYSDPKVHSEFNQIVNDFMRKLNGLIEDDTVSVKENKNQSKQCETSVEHHPEMFSDVDSHLDDLGTSNPPNFHPGEGSASGGLVDSNFCCSLDCGERGVDVDLISKFMKGNRLVMMDMEELRKEACDFCFYDDASVDLSEELVCDAVGVLKRTHVLSLVQAKPICPEIIDHWCFLLNAVEKQLKSKCCRFFFRVVDCAYLEAIQNSSESDRLSKELQEYWSEWLKMNSKALSIDNADMILLPLFHEGHYAVVAIDLKLKMIHFLDNLLHTSDQKEVYYSFVLTLSSHLLDFLAERRHLKSKEIGSYEFNFVEFDWSAPADNADNGLFAMVHLELFEGYKFSFDLDQALRRRYYRADMCASLFLSDINSIRDPMLDDMREFVKAKPDLTKNIQERRNAKKAKGKAVSKKEQVPAAKNAKKQAKK